MQFEQAMQEKTKIAEKIVRDHLDAYLRENHNPYVNTILEAMDYSVMAGGKRLRPLLMQEVFEMLSEGRTELRDERREALEVFMTAMEMIHTYSLVHDDLPAMDNDSFRRGKETTWKVYGDGMGVLAGDALLNAAFEFVFHYLQKEMEKGNAEHMAFYKAIVDCGAMLSQKACVDGMLGGQVADVEAEKKALPMSMERLLFIHAKKTAALIEASMGIGAILAGAAPKTVQKVLEIANKIGIAFQVQDDILDVEGDLKELGKPIGSDASSGKETFVTLIGLEESHKEVKRLSEEAVLELQGLPGDHEFLRELILFLIYRKK